MYRIQNLLLNTMWINSKRQELSATGNTAHPLFVDYAWYICWEELKTIPYPLLPLKPITCPSSGALCLWRFWRAWEGVSDCARPRTSWSLRSACLQAGSSGNGSFCRSRPSSPAGLKRPPLEDSRPRWWSARASSRLGESLRIPPLRRLCTPW